MKTRIIAIDASSAYNCVVCGTGNVAGHPTAVEYGLTINGTHGAWRAVYAVDGLAALQAVHNHTSDGLLPSDEEPNGLYDMICRLSEAERNQ